MIEFCDLADIRQEAAEADWDRNCEAAPKCDCCGESIYPYDTFFEYGDVILCERCADNHTFDIANLED